MAADSAIVNVEEWISEHYLTTDETKQSYLARVRGLVKGWKQDAGEGAISPLKRLTTARQSLLVSLSQLGGDEQARPASEEERAELRQALGYGAPGDLSWTRGESTWQAQAWAGDGVVLFEAAPVDTVEDLRSARVLGEVSVDAKPTGASVGKVLGEVFVSDAPPAFAVVLAGRWFLLAERESWPLGRFLAVDLLLALERGDTRSGGEIERVVAATCRESAERRADGTVWWTETLEDSRQHSVKVSESLRGAVRESIEIIANDVLDRRCAQGLGVDDVDGQLLARQSLRYMYRILFLLFAEASPELQVLPVGSTEYDDGYGLTRLRDQILSPPTTPREEQGTYLYESLALLFRLVDRGHHPEDEPGSAPGLEFNELSADLFSPAATSLIDQVRLSNIALYRVLANLLLTPEQPGKDRGFISYATLGVTELGQVYEGLMSYTGFIASEDLWEVARGGDDSKGSWVVGHDDSLEVAAADRVVRRNPITGEDEWVRHPRGSFVFRQSSRDRERSASFYTPQVLSEFVVGQAIAELDATGRIDRAEDILTLSICEPAMGSGAFAVEAVRQLAELYLERRQQELGDEIDPDRRTAELQKVKAYLALHRVYGVDLNATAVELAEIALWLDTMTPGLQAPWFGLHLRRGNSLIGARRATYSPTQVEKKQWLTAEPQDAPLSALAAAVDAESGFDPSVRGRIHHFLLPATGWGAAADAKDLAPYVGETQKELKTWRKQITAKPTKTQVQRLTDLAERVERLWQFSLVRMRIAEDQVRRAIDVYGTDITAPINPVPRAEIEKAFADRDGAFRRLRLAMDAWCALWFWPLTENKVTVHAQKVTPPSLDEWLAGLEALLGHTYSDTPKGRGRRAPGEGQIVLGSDLTWEQIDQAEDFDRVFAGEKPVESVLAEHPWLAVCEQVAADQGFFHWELDFAPVFSLGGFDLQVGNPPWDVPEVNRRELLAEIDPWWMLSYHLDDDAAKDRVAQTLSRRDAAAFYSRQFIEANATANFLASLVNLPSAYRPARDIYRPFIINSWRHASSAGSIGLIHPETHLTDAKDGPLRSECYYRLRQHWNFRNQKKLFSGIGNVNQFGVCIYSSPVEKITFLNASWLYSPRTAIQSLRHDGSGPLPGIKDENNQWDERPHRRRIITVDSDTLKKWNEISGDQETPLAEARMRYSVTHITDEIDLTLARAPRLGKVSLDYSRGLSGKYDAKSVATKIWGKPRADDERIIEGPNVWIATPYFQRINATMANHRDWLEVDLETLESATDTETGLKFRPHFNSESQARINYIAENSLTQCRVAWRTQIDAGGSRTLISSLIGPGISVSGSLNTLTTKPSIGDNTLICLIGASMSTFVVDHFVRQSGLANAYASTIETLPFPNFGGHTATVALAYLRLNSLTREYSAIYEEVTGKPWSKYRAARTYKERYDCQVVIDALTALHLGVSANDLCDLYRSQFPVVLKNDKTTRIDANGRKVPPALSKQHHKLKPGQELSAEERTWTHPQSGATYVFEYPFRILDREADMWAAHERFERELAEGELS